MAASRAGVCRDDTIAGAFRGAPPGFPGTTWIPLLVRPSVRFGPSLRRPAWNPNRARPNVRCACVHVRGFVRAVWGRWWKRGLVFLTGVSTRPASSSGSTRGSAVLGQPVKRFGSGERPHVSLLRCSMAALQIPGSSPRMTRWVRESAGDGVENDGRVCPGQAECCRREAGI